MPIPWEQGARHDLRQDTTDGSGGAFSPSAFPRPWAQDEQFQHSTRFTSHGAPVSAEFRARLAAVPEHPSPERVPGQAVPPPEASAASSRG